MGIAHQQDDRTLVGLFFDWYVFGFMKHDVEAAISGQANFLAALGLATYSEVLGALKLGTIRDKGGNQQKFEAFLPYLGAAYVQLDLQMKSGGRFKNGLYEVVRSGLVHEYFIKQQSEIDRHGVGVPSGIFTDPASGKLILIARKLLDDFLTGAANLRDDIIKSPDARTVSYMRDYVNLGDPAKSGLANMPSPAPTSGATYTYARGSGSTNP